jgi:hypothetical protein
MNLFILNIELNRKLSDARKGARNVLVQFKSISIPPAASFRSQAGRARACMQKEEEMACRDGRTCSPCDVDLSVWANAAAAAPRSAGHLI